MAEPEELTGAMIWLCSKTATYMTGGEVTIDGVVYSLWPNENLASVKDGSKFEGKELHLPAFIDNGGTKYPLKTIGGEAFKDCKGIEKIVIPESVTTIGMRAFSGCSALKSVIIPKSLTTFYSNRVFAGCSSLQQATLNDGLQTISNYAFANCTSLSYVAIPASVTSIADSAFNNDPNLTDYAVAKGISYTLLDNVKLGDANGDGLVNVNDITTMQRGIAEMTTLEGIYLHAADIDGNGECSIDDATYVQMFLAEYELTYPIDEVMTQ